MKMQRNHKHAADLTLIPRLHDPANVKQLVRVFWIHLLEVC